MKKLEKVSLEQFQNLKVRNTANLYGGGEAWTAVITGHDDHFLQKSRPDNPEWDTWDDDEF